MCSSRLGDGRRLLITVLAAGLAVAGARAAQAERRSAGGERRAALAPAVAALEIPCLDAATDGQCRRWALDGFYQALAATEDGQAARATRISFLGDSITASDHIPARLREVLGARFGDGGPGFLHLLPTSLCHHRAVRATSQGWRVASVASTWTPDRLLGFGGGAADSGGGARLRVSAATPVVTRAEVFYLAQPRGGTIDVEVDGARAATVTTAADGPRDEVAAVPVDGTLERLALRARGKVRLFGVVLEAARGVAVDNLGVVNSSARTWARIEPAHWRAQISRRSPDLMVVMIGANEAMWLGGKRLAGYERLMRDLLAPIRAARPDGACLVISPPAMVDYGQRKLPLRPAVLPMIAAQRAAAQATGCAFWDLAAWMGHAPGTAAWRRAGLVGSDFAYPTAVGNQRIADALLAALLDGYQHYRRP